MSAEAARLIEAPSPMRSDASGDAICRYVPCGITFTPRKPWQKFCCPDHRAAFHGTQGDGGLHGVVKSNRLLKGGKRSITLHLDASDPAGELLEPGKVAEIL